MNSHLFDSLVVVGPLFAARYDNYTSLIHVDNQRLVDLFPVNGDRQPIKCFLASFTPVWRQVLSSLSSATDRPFEFCTYKVAGHLHGELMIDEKFGMPLRDIGDYDVACC